MLAISAVNDGGKGKKGMSKTTGDKSKGKARARDKNKHKCSDGNKGMEQDSWNSGQQQMQFQGVLLKVLEVETQTRRLSDSIGATAEMGAVDGIQETGI